MASDVPAAGRTRLLTNGASSSQTETAIQKATAILNHIEGIETYITINGFSVMSGANTSNAATLFVMLKNLQNI